MMMLRNWTISQKLCCSFGFMVLLTCAIAVFVVADVRRLETLQHRLTDLREPTVNAASEVRNEINHSLAALRGYMILGTERFKEERRIAWTNLDGQIDKMKELSLRWTNPANKHRLAELMAILAEFRDAQQSIVDVAWSVDNLPATKILFADAVPSSLAMLDAITQMIDIEKKLGAGPKRKRLLGLMADARGSLVGGLASVRAYLLSGDKSFVAAYQKHWATNTERLSDLRAASDLMSPEQEKNFETYQASRSKFAALPQEMFDIRGADSWNVANKLLATEAAPRGFQAKNIVAEMILDQRRLVDLDVAAVHSHSEQLRIWSMRAGSASIVIGILATWFIIRSVRNPILRAMEVISEFGRGNYSVHLESDGKDEVSQMAVSLNIAIDSTAEAMRAIEELRARAQQDAHELESQKLAMDEHAIVAITDPSGKITYANDRFCQISQYSREELLGQDHRIVNSGYHPRKFFAALWKTISAGNVWHGDVCNRAKDGSEYWVDTTIVPFKDETDRITHYVVIRADITERKQTERNLARFRSALDCSADGVFLIDRASMRFVDANETACASLGYSRDELLDMGPQDIKPLISQEQLEKQFDDIITSKNEFGVVETLHQRRDGSTFPVEVFVKLFRDEIGTVLVAIARDISERKRVERQLIVARQDADAANQAKSDFLANMSHEIRTPMTAILGFAESLLDSDLSESAKLNYIHTIRRNGEGLLGIINDILDLSKIEAGKMDASRVSCEPCRVIAGVASLVRVQAHAKGLRLSIEYEGAIPRTIHTDPIRLRQILINLLGNAIKFTEIGTIRILTRFVDDAENDRGGSPQEPCLQFDVIDTGRGMAEEDMERLFQPFMQVDTSATRRIGGTGLGLTISKRFAELLGGDLTVVETEVGVGSTFRCTVATGSLSGVTMLEDPLSATVASDSTATIAQVANRDLGGVRILLAEDGPDNQKLISFVLKKAGADVTIVDNGKLALDAALAARDQGKPFDVILMDMQMPVMDGYEAMRQLRRRGYAAPIIALTAHAMASDREKCIEAGCNDYATKPIDRKKLIETIRKNLVPTEVGHQASA